MDVFPVLDANLVVAIMVALFSAPVLSYILETFPQVRELWGKVGKQAKPIVVVVLCLGLPFVIAFGKCYLPTLPVTVACPSSTAEVSNLIVIGGTAFVSSQVAFFGFADRSGKRVDDQSVG